MKTLIKIFLFTLALLGGAPAFAATNYCTDTNTAIGMKFDETSGTIADCGTHAQNASSQSGVTQNQTGVYGKSIKFSNNNNQVISVNASATINNINPITICMWAKNASYGSNNGDYNASVWLYNKNWRSMVFGLNSSGDLTFAAHTANGEYTWTTTNHSVTTGSFQHLCVSYDNTSPSTSPKFYVAGVLQSSNSNSVGGAFDDDSVGDLLIGQEGVGNIGNLSNIGRADSTIDELLVYKGALSGAAIISERDAGIDGSNAAGGGGGGVTPTSYFNNGTINNGTVQ